MNTRSKRASSVAIVLGFCVLAPVAPDGTLDASDRQHMAWSYSGIASGELALIASPDVAGAVTILRAYAGSVAIERAVTVNVGI